MLRLIVLAFSLAPPVHSPAIGQPVDTTYQSAPTSSWEPTSSVPDHDSLNAQLLALDFSGTVQGTPLADQSRTAARYALQQADSSQYLVLALFGTYVRVLEDRFLHSDTDRKALVDDLSHAEPKDFPRIEKKTDIGNLEWLAHQVWAALKSAHPGQGVRLKVVIISDGEAEPVDPDETQTLSTFLGQSTTRSTLGGGLHVYTTTLKHPAAPTPRAGDSTESDSTSVGSTSGGNASLNSGRKWGLAAGAIALLLGLTSLPFLVGRRDAGRPDGSTTTDLSEVVVEEWDHRGESPTQVGGSARIPLQHGEPITIGYGPNCVVSLFQENEDTQQSGEPDVAVVVTPRQHELTISPRTDGLEIDEAPLGDDVTVDPAGPHSISGDGWEIRLLPEQKASHTLFTDLIDQSQRDQ